MIAYNTDIFHVFACSSSQFDVTILKKAYNIIAIKAKLAEVSSNEINGLIIISIKFVANSTLIFLSNNTVIR
jgi:hypothetical protein